MRRKIKNKEAFKRKRRHMHIRNRVSGTPDQPRVAVFRSSQHIYAQVIDDTAGNTIVAVSSLKIDPSKLSASTDEEGKKGKKDKKATAAGTKVLMAREVGRLLAEAAKEKGVSRVQFDRGGFLYHGRIAALADGARKAGLEF